MLVITKSLTSPFHNKLIVMPWLASRSTLHHRSIARSPWIWAAMPKPSPAWQYSHHSLCMEGKPVLGVAFTASKQAFSTMWNLTYHHIATPGVERGFLEVLCHLICQPHAVFWVLESTLKHHLNRDVCTGSWTCFWWAAIWTRLTLC